MTTPFSIEQFLGAGAFASITGVIGIAIARGQAIKTANTAARAQVDVKRLDMETILQGYAHSDAVSLRAALDTANAKILGLIERVTRAEAKVERLVEDLTEAHADVQRLTEDLNSARALLDRRRGQQRFEGPDKRV